MEVLFWADTVFWAMATATVSFSYKRDDWFALVISVLFLAAHIGVAAARLSQ